MYWLMLHPGALPRHRPFWEASLSETRSRPVEFFLGGKKKVKTMFQEVFVEWILLRRNNIQSLAALRVLWSFTCSQSWEVYESLCERCRWSRPGWFVKIFRLVTSTAEWRRWISVIHSLSTALALGCLQELRFCRPSPRFQMVFGQNLGLYTLKFFWRRPCTSTKSHWVLSAAFFSSFGLHLSKKQTETSKRPRFSPAVSWGISPSILKSNASSGMTGFAHKLCSLEPLYIRCLVVKRKGCFLSCWLAGFCRLL